MVIKREDIFKTFTRSDGSTFVAFKEQKALALLLLEGVVHWFPRELLEENEHEIYVAPPNFTAVKSHCMLSKIDGPTLGTEEDLEELTKMHLDDPKYGAVKWICLKQRFIPYITKLNRLKEAGVWCEKMVALEEELNNEKA